MRWRVLALTCAAMLALPAMARAEPAPPNCAPATNQIPPRAASAPAGADFARQVAPLGERDRDAAIRDALLGGNVPPFLRRRRADRTDWPRDRRRGHPRDAVRAAGLPPRSARPATPCVVPMASTPALAVADAFGFVLPTRRMGRRHLPAGGGPTVAAAAAAKREDALHRLLRATQRTGAAQRTAAAATPAVLDGRAQEGPRDQQAAVEHAGPGGDLRLHRSERAPIQPLSVVHGRATPTTATACRLVSTTPSSTASRSPSSS